MAFYLVQLRHLKLKNGALPSSYPVPVRASIIFGPDDAFGVHSNAARTTIARARPASILWNANEGTTAWNAEFIEQLTGTSTTNGIHADVQGNRVSLAFSVGSFEEAGRIVTCASHLLPALLSLHLRTFVWIKQFPVEIGESKFNFEVIEASGRAVIADAVENSKHTMTAITQWLAARDQARRIITAFYYFRNAERFAIMEPDPHTTVAEVTLNLTKALDVLCSGDRDALREIGKNSGIDPQFIEEKIIPLHLIRNSLDVAHVALGPFTSGDRDAILTYVQRAMTHVREFLERVADAVNAGVVQLEVLPETLDSDKRKLIAKIEEYGKR
jgi:hypothetical protein